MTNPLDSLITTLSPAWGLRRARARASLRAYESATASRTRRGATSRGSGDAVTGQAGEALRQQARALDENHDLARGVLNTLVGNVVGRGLTVEPTVRDRSGELLAPVNDALMEAWAHWTESPEASRTLHYSSAERLACRSWLRDGEVFAQLLAGRVAGLTHGGAVPFSIELIESDFCPFDLDRPDRGIVQGVGRNAWGRPVAYYLYKTHPGNDNGQYDFTTKSVPAERIAHVKLSDRIGQARGVSIFASVLNRLDGIKDYEESELVAAKVAASMAAYIKKGTPDDYANPATDDEREMKFAAGMVFDDLRVGEDIGTINTTRPNVNLEAFRKGQLRAIAAGTQSGYSSVSKDYSGSYSSQRQELVEQAEQFQVLRDMWVANWSRPIWRAFVDSAMMSGRVPAPASLDYDTRLDAEFYGTNTPWIDPDKEGKAFQRAVRSGFMSSAQVIRRMGGNPGLVYKQIAKEQALADSLGLVLDSDPRHEQASEV